MDAELEIIADALSHMGLWDNTPEALWSVIETDYRPEIVEGVLLDRGTADALRSLNK